MGGRGERRRTLDPVFNVLDILVRVLQILLHVVLVRVEEVGFGGAAFVDRHAPRAVLDSGRDISREGILFQIS